MTDSSGGIARPSSCQVRLDELDVMADIGAHANELGVPQPLRIHVAIDIVPPGSDALALTFDYNEIRRFALELASQRIVLIETFAHRLAQMCLAHEGVLAVDVRVAKPRAVPGCLASARVRICTALD